MLCYCLPVYTLRPFAVCVTLQGVHLAENVFRSRAGSCITVCVGTYIDSGAIAGRQALRLLHQVGAHRRSHTAQEIWISMKSHFSATAIGL